MAEMKENLKVIEIEGRVYMGVLADGKVQAASQVSAANVSSEMGQGAFNEYVVDEYMGKLINMDLDNASVVSRELNDEEVMLYQNAVQRMNLAEKFAAKQMVVNYFQGK